MNLSTLKQLMWLAAGEIVYRYYRRRNRKRRQKEARARRLSLRTKVPNTIGDKND